MLLLENKEHLLLTDLLSNECHCCPAFLFPGEINKIKNTHVFHSSVTPLQTPRLAVGCGQVCLFIFYCCSCTVVSIVLPPLSHPYPYLTSHFQSFCPLALSMGPLYIFLDNTSPFFPHYPPTPTTLIAISLFFMSMSPVIFCLLVCFID